MYRSLFVAATLLALVGCSSLESASRPGDSGSDCSKQYLGVLERNKKDSMSALEAAFSELDRNPSQKNLDKKDRAAMAAAMAASDLDYARALCEIGPNNSFKPNPA